MKNCRRAVLVLLTMALLVPFLIQPASADIVTDTLTVKVGYFGMAPEDYIEVETYQWWELEEALPLHEETYSFFRGDALNRPGEMRTVVDSARGFYLTDLLDFAGIYLGDVSSLSFYTRDQEVGSFVSFTAQELFRHDRFYFENLSMHLRDPYRDESGKLVYDDSEAWGFARVVEPMLALEDNWANFEISNNETPPNFDGLHAGNRFRLLFGQHEPQATETNKSAKYVHTVLVTLSGTAIYTPDPPELDGTIGSHEVKMNVTVSNGDLLGALNSILRYASSDESVMRVTGWSIEYSDTASDLAIVTIQYDVIAEGDATINGYIAGSEGTYTPLTTVTTGSTAPKQPDRPDPGPTAPPSPDPGTTDPSNPDPGPTDPANPDPGPADPATPAPAPSDPAIPTPTPPGSATPTPAIPDADDGAQIIVTPDGLPGLRVELSEKDRQLLTQSETAAAPRLVIPLSPELAARLRSAQEPAAASAAETAENPPQDAASGPERDALEVAPPERQTEYLVETGLAALALLLAGGLYAAWTFRKERGKKL